MERVKLVQTTEIQLSLTELQARQLLALLFVTAGGTEDISGLFGPLNTVLAGILPVGTDEPEYRVYHEHAFEDITVTYNSLSIVPLVY